MQDSFARSTGVAGLVIMMRPLLLILAISSACATTPEVPPPARRMPSASPDLGGGLPALPTSCMTRYDSSDLKVHFTCQTALVGGDPHHYVTTCPQEFPLNARHSFPGPEFYGRPVTSNEVVLDAAGNLSHEVTTHVAPHKTVVTVMDWYYDGQGRLSERKISDGTGKVTFDSIVGERDAEGRPLTTSNTQDPIEVYGVTYPGTAHSTGELGYGEDGRLATVQYRYQPSGFLTYDRTIVYDDVARRRSYFTTVDIQPLVPTAGGAGHATSYDVVDEDGRIIELENIASEQDPEWRSDLRYDDGGRLMTAISTSAGSIATASYIYDCP
jgi:YD repeat-containing protein